jgi:hypothetical protein
MVRAHEIYLNKRDGVYAMFDLSFDNTGKYSYHAQVFSTASVATEGLCMTPSSVFLYVITSIRASENDTAVPA